MAQPNETVINPALPDGNTEGPPKAASRCSSKKGSSEPPKREFLEPIFEGHPGRSIKEKLAKPKERPYTHLDPATFALAQDIPGRNIRTPKLDQAAADPANDGQPKKKVPCVTNPAYAYVERYPSTALSLARRDTRLLLSRGSHNARVGPTYTNVSKEVKAAFQWYHSDQMFWPHTVVEDAPDELGIPPPPPPPISPAEFEKKIFTKAFPDIGIHYCLESNMAQLGYMFPVPVQSACIIAQQKHISALITSPVCSFRSSDACMAVVNGVVTSGIRDKQRYACSIEPNTNFPLALIVTNTYEAAQTYAADCLALIDPDGSREGALSRHIHIACFHGGISLDDIVENMATPTEQTFCDIVIATPGTLVRLLTNGTLHLRFLQHIVWDDIKKLAHDSFSEEVQHIKTCIEVMMHSAVSFQLDPAVEDVTGTSRPTKKYDPPFTRSRRDLRFGGFDQPQLERRAPATLCISMGNQDTYLVDDVLSRFTFGDFVVNMPFEGTHLQYFCGNITVIEVPLYPELRAEVIVTDANSGRVRNGAKVLVMSERKYNLQVYDDYILRANGTSELLMRDGKNSHAGNRRLACDKFQQGKTQFLCATPIGADVNFADSDIVYLELPTHRASQSFDTMDLLCKVAGTVGRNGNYGQVIILYDPKKEDQFLDDFEKLREMTGLEIPIITAKNSELPAVSTPSGVARSASDHSTATNQSKTSRTGRSPKSPSPRNPPVTTIGDVDNKSQTEPTEFQSATALVASVPKRKNMTDGELFLSRLAVWRASRQYSTVVGPPAIVEARAVAEASRAFDAPPSTPTNGW